MDDEHHSPEGPERRRPGCLVAVLAGVALVIAIIVGFAIWIDGAFPECGPETAGDTAGFCQGPSPSP